jgi:kinesin family protein C1
MPCAPQQAASAQKPSSRSTSKPYQKPQLRPELRGAPSSADSQPVAQEPLATCPSELSDLRAALESSQEDNTSLTEQVEALQAARYAAEQAAEGQTRELANERAAHEREAAARKAAECERDELRAALAAAEAMAAAAEARAAELGEGKEAVEAELREREHEVAFLAERGRAQEELRRQLHETISELKGSIRVFCRVRPALVHADDATAAAGIAPASLARVPAAKDNSAASMEPTLLDLFAPPRESSTSGAPAGGKSKDDKPLRFKFDRVFAEGATQEDIFREVSQLTQSAIDGFKVCIFAYGQTGSGKTFTMSGGAAAGARGVIPRAAEQVFTHCAQLQLLGWQFEFRASALEIYNEELRDLLPAELAADTDKAAPKDGKLRVVDVKGEVSVPGLRSATVHDAVELESMLEAASKVRSTASTRCNASSSRSHYIFRMRILGKNLKTGASSEGELNLVDLAGSERIKESGVSGAALKEAQCINTSLSALGKVIASMSEKKASSKAHVPFRDSKLTHLLQSSLSGSAKMLMFVNISPQEKHYSETKSSLQFAAKANAVEVGPAKKSASGPSA